MPMSEDGLRKMVEQSIAFVARSGLTAPELRPGRVKCRMPLKGNENHIGTMYAGALFTLAEIPGGALSMTSFDMSRTYPIVKSMDISFLKPAQSDITIEIGLDQAEIQRIQTEAESRGKSEFVLEGELRDQNREIVAISRGIYQLRRIDR